MLWPFIVADVVVAVLGVVVLGGLGFGLYRRARRLVRAATDAGGRVTAAMPSFPSGPTGSSAQTDDGTV